MPMTFLQDHVVNFNDSYNFLAKKKNLRQGMHFAYSKSTRKKVPRGTFLDELHFSQPKGLDLGALSF